MQKKGKTKYLNFNLGFTPFRDSKKKPVNVTDAAKTGKTGFSFLPKSLMGFTLIELLVGIFIFTILVSGVISVYAILSRTVKLAREKTVLASLASSHLETVRNLPYADVGTINGNPKGALADFTNAINVQIEGFSYKIYYEVTFVDDPADGIVGGIPNDPAPADYKQVKMSILNVATNQVTDFLTSVSPKGLEGTQNAGAIKVKVFNYMGQRIPDADIHIQYPTSSPAIILDRKSDINGEWIEVGLPAAINNYRIVVTKPGYSTDQTYPITAQNPNPAKPDVTVVNGQVSEISFSIDLLANLTIKTVNELCQNIDGIDLNVRGDKLIGINPLVYKFNQDFTSASGQILLNNIEWDTYTPTLLIGQSWVVRGTSPIQKIEVQPGSNQTFTMVLSQNSTANSLLVIVKDASSGAALEGATIHLRKGGSVPQDYYGITGGSVWAQAGWTGGAGQINWSTSTPDSYFADDGNVDVNSVPTGVRLKKISGRYQTSGWLESSVFDTGSDSSNFTTITWSPSSQNPAVYLEFQLASASDPAGPWEYVGPDGTVDSFYSVSGSNISTVHDNKRYLRYKVYLSTTDDRETPVLTSLQINYVSG
ncbi:MAG: type II secretion system protein, partial [Candidatus Doudnabacteria bacterium]|nr:type II secretion system protein [Candidatus Doudnabacteria bacterium]